MRNTFEHWIEMNELREMKNFEYFEYQFAWSPFSLQFAIINKYELSSNFLQNSKSFIPNIQTYYYK